MKNFFNDCINEAEIAYMNNDVPIGAVIVFNNKIIGRGHNNRSISNDVTDHAEIMAIREAAKIIGDWRLDECDIYVTLEPCAMCKEVIKEARIKNAYYLVRKEDYKHSSDKTNFQQMNEESFQQLILMYKEKLSAFFKINCNR